MDCERGLFEKLYLLAELKPGTTLCVGSMTIIDHTRFNSWYRWWYDEDRHKTLDAIYQIIDKTKEHYFKAENKTAIKIALLQARKGISNLIDTYQDDPVIKSRINSVLLEIDTFLHEILTPPTSLWIPNYFRSQQKESEEKEEKKEDNLD
jgi:hypothetical protein